MGLGHQIYILLHFRKEDMILSHSFQHIKASIKDLIKIYNDNFSANNQIKEENKNGYKS